MEQIYDTKHKLQTFDFSKLALSKPTLISGGNYFIRFKKDNMNLYLQPPSCNTRNGFIKNGRKYYTDLLFTNDDEYIIQWFERLEEHCIQFIYENRKAWFDGDMEKADIENYFTSPLKIYKSGKFYLVRTNIPTALEQPIIKIYDEEENLVDYTTIIDSTKLMNIVEIQGIKCSAKSFQIEIEMKQALVIKPQDTHMFDKCIIQPKQSLQIQSEEEPLHVATETNETSLYDTITPPTGEQNELIVDVIENTKDTIIDNDIVNTDNNETNNLGNFTETNIVNNANNKTIIDETDSLEQNPEESELLIDTPEIMVNTSENTNDMEEIDFNLEDLSTHDKVVLREPSEVYYQMYRDARQKAKMAKELALSSYLEAKSIKNTYMLTDIDDSDTSDLELDDESIISENESL